MKKYILATALIISMFFVLLACDPAEPENGEDNGESANAGEGDPEVTANAVVDAADAPYWESARLGFDAFQDPALAGSENEKSCQSCHPWGGKYSDSEGKERRTLVGSAASFPKVVPMATGMFGEDPISLVDMINFCITTPLGGNALEEGDELMQNLVDFHNALNPYEYGADILPIINTKCVGCHTGAVTSGHNWTDEKHFTDDAMAVRMNIESGEMPQVGELTDKEFLTLINWATFILDSRESGAAHTEVSHDH